jgi:hypothetical protein
MFPTPRSSARPDRPRRRTTVARLALAFVAVLAVAASLPSPASAEGETPQSLPSDGTSSPNFVGAPWFQPGAVYDQNFPDPSVLYDPATDLYYAFGTTTGGVNVPVESSPDLVTWTARPNHTIANANGEKNDALPDPSPSWVTWHSSDPRWPDDLWAPGVTRIGSRWVMFYALRVDQSGRRCLFYATSDRPDGPYLDPEFLYCSDDPMGSIDPQPYTDPATGTNYLVWKDEGQVGDHGQRLWARPVSLTSDTRVSWTPGSLPTILLESRDGWEHWVTENPSLARLDDGSLVLFYSGGSWDTEGYAVGMARCRGLGFSWTEVCTRTTAGPVMNRRQGRTGIGGTTAFRGRGGELYLADHYWEDGIPAGYPENQRRLMIDRVHQVAGRIVFSGEPGPTGPAPPAAYRPLAPQRVLDTRDGTGTSAARLLEPGEVTVLDLSTRVRASATAVTLNVTVDAPQAPGFVTAYPCGSPPDASNLNYRPGDVVPDLVTVQLNASRHVCLYTSASTHLIADLQGTYDSGGGAGLVGVSPQRLLDTRGSGRVAQGHVVEVQVAGRAGVPVGASAAVLNLTADGAIAPGYLTAWDCVSGLPGVSNVNFGVRTPSSNAALVPLSPSGTVCVYAYAGTDVIVDVFGSVAPGGGAFTARSPVRLTDTRGSGVPVGAGQVLPVQVVGLGAAPVGTTSVVLTVTATEARADGWVGAFPCASPPTGGFTSNLNFRTGETRAAHVTVPVGADGKVCLLTLNPTHLIVDLAGSFS